MRKRLLILLAILASFSLLAAACGDDDGETTDTDDTTDTTDTTDTDMPETDVSVGLVFDTTGRGDQSFNDSAAAGVDRAVAELGVAFTEATPNADGSNRAELLQLAADEHDIVLAVGFAFGDTLGPVATDNPDVHFVGVDTFVPDFDNVLNLAFAEEQGSFLMGVVAALKTETDSVGFIGGVDMELIQKFEAGFVAGAQAVNPDIDIAVEYIAPEGDFSGFNAPDRAKEIAASMYDGGADVVYHAAGGSGLGLFQAAQDAGAWGIGVDSDQWALLPDLQDVILTSMLKPVDSGIFDAIKSEVDVTFEGGFRTLDLTNGGIGYSTSGGHIDDIVDQVEEYAAQIAAGDIVVPTTPS